jgi:hypothetical protein
MVDEPVDTSSSTFERSREPQQVEPVWILTKGDRWLSCELRDDDDEGWEAQVFRNGELCLGYLLATRTAALAHVATVRACLEREGWRLIASVQHEYD